MHAGFQILGMMSKERFAERVRTYLCRLIHICLCSLFLVLYSCRGDEVVYPTIGTHVTEEVRTGGLYVLCEGNMGSNKARLDYMNLESGEYYSNWYGAQNPKQMKELGDVGNDIQVHGNRLYAVINCSHKVEVMDLKARHIGRVDLPNCRYIAFRGDKMYVSAYVGSIADPQMNGSVYEVDTASLNVTREVKVGHQPDELCIIGNKLYVVNSGGYLVNRHDSTVSVIDLDAFTEIQRIVVGKNPQRIRADRQNRLWVCTDDGLYIIDNDIVQRRIDIIAGNISISGTTAYIIERETDELRMVSTTDFSISSFSFHMPPMFEHPYGLLATPDALYITDAKNYVSSGVLYCYGYDGQERWRAQTGDIPGHLCRVSGAYELHGDTVQTVNQSSRFISRVYEYVPAMGQFVNELPQYEEGDDALSMCRKCEQAIADNAGGLVSLGGWGGYITFGFDHPVINGKGHDIQILGNAFYMSGSVEYGSSEPGIVMVSRDDNGNGLPDDNWYELKGSLYNDPHTRHGHTHTYTRESDTLPNQFHQHPYYPQWIAADELTFTGTKLPSQAVFVNGQHVQRILEYGYADNKPNSDKEGSSVDIDWAVDEMGNPVALHEIHFVRVYTAVDDEANQTGEISTEIAGAIDLHANL